MNAVGGNKLRQAMVAQEGLPHRDQGNILPQGDLRRRVGVQLLVAIDHLGLPQPGEDTVPPQVVPAQEGQIPLPVDGRQGHHDRLHAALAQGVQGLVQGVGKHRQLRVGPVVGAGVGVNGGPVIVAVFSERIPLLLSLLLLQPWHLPLPSLLPEWPLLFRPSSE